MQIAPFFTHHHVPKQVAIISREPAVRRQIPFEITRSPGANGVFETSVCRAGMEHFRMKFPQGLLLLAAHKLRQRVLMVR